MRNNRTAIIKYMAAIIAALIIACGVRVNVFAAEAVITVTADTKEFKTEEDLSVQVAITAPDPIGTYYVELEYDETRMQYIGGADDQKDNMIILTGTGTEGPITYLLEFVASAPGQAGVHVKRSLINTADGSGSFSVAPGQVVPIGIAGGNSGEAFTDKIAREAEEALMVIGTVTDESGRELSIIDHSLYVPEDAYWFYRLVNGYIQGQEVTFLTDRSEHVHILYLADNDRNFFPVAVAEDGGMYNVRSYGMGQGFDYMLVSMDAVLSKPEELEGENQAEYTAYAIDSEGNGGFYHIGSSGNLIDWREDYNKKAASPIRPWMIYLMIALAVVAVVIIIVVLIRKNRDKAVNIPFRQQSDDEDDIDLEFISLEGSNGADDEDDEIMSAMSKFEDSIKEEVMPETVEDDLDELLKKL